MKTSIAAALALTLFAGSASAMIHKKDVIDRVNSANSFGTVVANFDGSTVILTGSVDSVLDARIVANAAGKAAGVDQVINRISTRN